MNGLMIKSLAFSALLIVATIAVVMSLDIDIFADSVNAITMGGAIAIAVLTSAVSVKYINQMKTDVATGELADESWDGVREYKNELPSGWAYSFLGLFLWSMWYGFVGYPINAYSQIGEYNEEVLAYNAKFESIHKNADESTLREMGESIYLVQCAQCHGNTGDGLDGKAQDFTKLRSKQEVLDIINKGQNTMTAFPGGMYPGMAAGEQAEEISAYVAGGMTGAKPASFAACSSCHGENGEGVSHVGPKINGYDMVNTLAKGKHGSIGKMPAFNTLITPIQEKALTVYIQSMAK
ncbi:MAG: cytochrome C oxidase subunit III [Epsilonproteobacteria bacterium]|nr:MAG: cytochrome C oxidase subunit III [Campylobacterota bacterium]